MTLTNTAEEALKKAKAIRKVQGKFHADYTFDDLELALTELGFDSTSFAVADERW